MNQTKIVLVAGMILAAGCKGPNGSKGAAGPDGPSGPIGPVSAAPAVASVYPRTATPATKIRIRGTGFSPTVADDSVVVNGTSVTVLSATGTEIWATDLPAATTDLQDALLTVSVSGLQSNALPMRLGLPGDIVYSEAKQMGYLSAATVSADEKTAFMADQYAYDPLSGNSFTAIYQYDFESGVFSTVYTSTNIYYITAMAWGPDGKLYLGAEDWETGYSGLYRFGTAFDDSTLVALTTDATCDITALAWAANGDLWMGDSCARLHVRQADGQFFYNVYQTSDDNAINHLMPVGSGMLVVGDYYVTLIDGALPSSSYVNDTYHPTIGAATDDGTNLFLLRGDSTSSIEKMTPGLTTQTVTSFGVADSSNFVTSSGGHFLLRLKNGDSWFSAGNSSLLNKVSAQGVVTQEWFSPYEDWYYAAIAGDSTFYSSGDGCDYGVGSPIIRQNLEGQNTIVAKDFCGYSNFSVANGKVYGADPRGWVIEIDPATNATAVVSTSPALGIPSAFATDGMSFFVAQANTAGNYNIVKIGFGDSPQVDLNFVTNLPNQPAMMQAIGNNLYFVDGAAHKVPLAGGLVTDAIDPALGFTSLYSIGVDVDGTPIFSDYYGSYETDAGGNVHILSSSPVWFASPDDFGSLSGIYLYDGLRAQVLQ